MAETKKRSPILLILLILSLILNGYLYYLFTQNKNTNEELSARIVELNDRVSGLESIESALNSELDETISELDEFKGLSEELDSLLVMAKADLEERQNRIRKLSRQVTMQKELEVQLQKELAELKSLKDNYMEKIDSLIQTNNLLQTQVEDYQRSVDSLGQKVQQGSILNTDNLNITAYKEKRSGKLKPTVIASKTEEIEICFDLMENKIAPAGEKEVFVRIISPEGVTLGTQAGGGGTFEVQGDTIQNRYTIKGMASYENKRKNYCINWSDDMEFQKGNYQVEVYTDGYFSGVGAFILK